MLCRGVSTRARGWAFMWRSIAVVVSVSIGGSSIISATAEDNGLALRPPMGWNPWNCWANSGDGVTEGIVMAAARVMAAKLKPSGYEYINLDCGWSTKHRDPVTGTLLVNSTRFPSGMKSLADQIHGLGLKFGMYGAMGYAQCCSGSADQNATDGSGPGCNKDAKHKVCRNETFYDRDAKLWASWEIDLLKFDGCGGGFSSVAAMGSALNATGRPIVYSVHGSVKQDEMNTSLANMWRTGPDIGASYEQVLDRAMIANTVDAYLRGGPGGWNDPDMLQVGNIGRKANGGSPPSLYPEAEGRTQFALWCILKSPLLIGSFLHNMTDATFATLTNKVAIGVNQDVLGEQAVLRKDGGWVPDKPRPTTNVAYGYQIWSGALANGGAAVVLANLDGNASQVITLTNNEMPSSRRGNAKWDITEAFTGTVMPGVVLPKETTVGRHDIAMWVLRPAV
eukprot:m.419673 g.419673  ORF g.419673 m.419673 type:complete len:451 (-) comp31717_c0_seq1:89-1441(-)